MTLPDKYYGEQNLKLAKTLLDKQGEINRIKADIKKAEATIERAAEHARHWIKFGNPDYAQAGRQILADLAQPGDQPKDTT